jgi:hypothetical protein
MLTVHLKEGVNSVTMVQLNLLLAKNPQQALGLVKCLERVHHKERTPPAFCSSSTCCPSFSFVTCFISESGHVMQFGGYPETHRIIKVK